jgi:hypothetical protein
MERVLTIRILRRKTRADATVQALASQGDEVALGYALFST